MLILSRQSNIVIGDPLEFAHLGVVATSGFEITTMQSHEGDVFASAGFPTIRRCEGLPRRRRVASPANTRATTATATSNRRIENRTRRSRMAFPRKV